MHITDLPFARGFIRVCDDGWLKGWHERNGGNLSYRLSKAEAEEAAPLFTTGDDWREIKTSVPALAGEYFMCTGSGKFMRNIRENPAANTCIIQVDESGARYRLVWGLTEGGIPSSELPTHLMNHEVKKNAGSLCRVIYHAHPVNLISLTFVLPPEGKAFTRELWEAMTECPVIFPEGVGTVPWMVPGGRDIAVASARLMETFNAVVWFHHGLFCAGATFDEAFGLMDAIEKAAEISVKIRSMGDGKKRQTITTENLKQLAEGFGLSLSPLFI
ncbi:MAG: rhamnulose-1-phosphate aldolase [Spirochaetaceae bacterium]|jgi:rhamnulose-1-phosphate aldolase|nr:rhamnulose-1-phosphate aldolase [Spirochaetaceae bacterium]